MKTFTRSILTVGLLLAFVSFCCADWTGCGTVNGVRVYRDNATGLEWTQTLGQVNSSGWGKPAQAMVSKYGFRLPSFSELQAMERHGGFSRLRINNGSYQYYETSNSSVLGAAYGNGFRTPQQRKGAGRNWVIGVRNTVAENNNATVTTSSTVSTPVSTPISATPVTGSTVVATNSVSNQTNNNDDKQNSNESNNGLPVLPNYDD